jgi:SAM-dependent methyltransferase
MTCSVLIVTPDPTPSRVFTHTLSSIARATDHALANATDIARIDHAVVRATQTGTPQERVAQQYNHARRLVLDGGYDAMLIVESDIIIPDDAIEKLWSVDADVVTGLYVFRRQPYEWNAYSALHGMAAAPLSHARDGANIYWGRTFQVQGMGLGCLLIRRIVLEHIEFRHTGVLHGRNGKNSHCDWYFWQDLQLAKTGFGSEFVAACDSSVVCGHIHGGAVPAALYPCRYGDAPRADWAARFIPMHWLNDAPPDDPVEYRYEELLATPMDMQHHVPRLRDYAEGTVVELGCRYGSSTTAFLAGLQERGGHLYSIDIADDDVKHTRKQLGDHPQWTFIRGDSHDADVAAQVPAIDVLLIDSLHTYDQVKGELALWAPKVKSGGRILLHDWEVYPGIVQIVREWAAANNVYVEWHPQSCGLVEMRIPERIDDDRDDDRRGGDAYGGAAVADNPPDFGHRGNGKLSPQSDALPALDPDEWIAV